MLHKEISGLRINTMQHSRSIMEQTVPYNPKRAQEERHSRMNSPNVYQTPTSSFSTAGFLTPSSSFEGRRDSVGSSQYSVVSNAHSLSSMSSGYSPETPGSHADVFPDDFLFPSYPAPAVMADTTMAEPSGLTVPFSPYGVAKSSAYVEPPVWGYTHHLSEAPSTHHAYHLVHTLPGSRSPAYNNMAVSNSPEFRPPFDSTLTTYPSFRHEDHTKIDVPSTTAVDDGLSAQGRKKYIDLFSNFHPRHSTPLDTGVEHHRQPSTIVPSDILMDVEMKSCNALGSDSTDSNLDRFELVGQSQDDLDDASASDDRATARKRSYQTTPTGAKRVKRDPYGSPSKRKSRAVKSTTYLNREVEVRIEGAFSVGPNGRIQCNSTPSKKLRCTRLTKEGRPCLQTFGRPEHLKRHEASTHAKERPFKCPVPGCGVVKLGGRDHKPDGGRGGRGHEKKFTRTDNRTQHYVTHSTGSKSARNIQIPFAEMCKYIIQDEGPERGAKVIERVRRQHRKAGRAV
ncbi:hypothetical protein BDY21DRAFT_375741 [Lineolata rhizophorae]|uniref:C2H2-type domain-containing protein n=1 Tax=Lineolata rhizophorae TaxID=578093 RepID=A0A6A6PDF0_9PEZI|nr:hypothetical protein BDY21DRAFT_375741 [Lineolata rhizophorae]